MNNSYILTVSVGEAEMCKNVKIGREINTYLGGFYLS